MGSAALEKDKIGTSFANFLHNICNFDEIHLTESIMQNKLQELTDKLYSQGLSKGKAEAEEIIKKAKQEAQDIIAGAKSESQTIITKANEEAQDIKSKVINEIRISSKQVLSSLKQEIENIVTAKSVTAPVKEAMKDTEFFKKVLLGAIAAFNPKNSEAIDLRIMLPDSMKNELDSFIQNSIVAQSNSKIEITYGNKISGGFTIGPKDEGYVISFNDDNFIELLSQYIRPKTREILFSE